MISNARNSNIQMRFGKIPLTGRARQIRAGSRNRWPPFLPEFSFAPADARFIGNPIDFVVFDGYTQAKDEKGDAIGVVFVEVKKGKGKLTREETLIKRAVEKGRISWRTIFLKDEIGDSQII